MDEKYKVVYSVPGYAPIVHEYDDYDRAKNVYNVRSGCKTNKGEITKLLRVRADNYEVELLSSDYGGKIE